MEPITVTIELGDDFVERVAAVVAARLQASAKAEDWPRIDTPLGPSPSNPCVTVDMDQQAQEFLDRAQASLDHFGDNLADADPKLGNKMADRKEELKYEDVRTLRKKVAKVENKLPSDYTLSKEELIDHIVRLEAILGRTLDEELFRSAGEIPDDTKLDEPEPNDDSEVEPLTKDVAELMDLKDLKRYAISQDIDPADLVGLDVEAVVDLLFGKSVQAAQPEPIDKVENNTETEEIIVDEDYIKNASIGELKSLAIEFERDYKIHIQYDNLTKRPELVEKLLKALDKIPDE